MAMERRQKESLRFCENLPDMSEYLHYTFCTLFDKNYLYKGLALYQSLNAHCKKFTLWILCMDDITYSILEKMQLENVRLIPLKDFEDDDLRKVKRERTVAEYCWTCTSPLIIYVMQRESQTDHVAYLDADLFFYSNPYPIYDEFCNNSILIIEHRFSPQYKSMEATSGIYNVSMVIFRNDTYGLECLNWWKEQCLKACHLDAKAGYAGDQKYLDDWPSRFKNVVILQHKGSGLAPWNIFNYRINAVNGKIYVDSDELIFYHFHSLQIAKKYFFVRHPIAASAGYNFTRQQINMIYLPYVRELHSVIDKVKKINSDFVWGYGRLSLYEIIMAVKKRNLLLI